ncbi:EOGT [Branchiostoma lanceolatum]|uniref:EOGT protein n=1 Tax=Branchiostoma lanceolatum TaxID=7740 RepID=A0A8K0A1Z2_BRALA|nr:EOGT [Branchiostoma lanceolatum]
MSVLYTRSRWPPVLVSYAIGLVMSWSGSSHTSDVSTQPTCPALAHLRLPPEHLPYYLYSHPEVAAAVRNDTQCYRQHWALLPCWGYEEDCPPESRYSPPVCAQEWERGKRHKLSNTERFWRQAGFGYVREQRRQLVTLCEARSQEDSWLECSHYARYCRGRNLYLDFRRLKIHENHFGKRFRRDILGPGDIGGRCKVITDRLKNMAGHEVHGLMSWYAELENFTSLNFRPTAGNENCDVILDTPTYFMKLDLGINMYHHFCNFLNLYISQHVNGSFSTDVNIIVWDTSGRSYMDMFGDAWRAFTDHPLIHLKDYDGKRVPGCNNSGLVRAFSRHVLYRLGIDHGRSQSCGLCFAQDGRLRVTLLSRTTRFRQVLNEDQHTQNTDIFIGIHGAGLTHALFLPDWACLLEIYNCGDEPCYRNLAALRGVGYVTWEGSAGLTQMDELGTYKGGAYDKFVNYTVNPTEFRRLVEKAIMYVFNHPAFPSTHMHAKEEL